MQSLVLVAMQFAKSVENWSIDTEGTIKYQRRHFVHPLHAGPAHIRSALHPRALLSRDASPVGKEREFVFACLAMCITYEVHVLACRGTAPSILPIWLKHSLHSLAYTSLVSIFGTGDYGSHTLRSVKARCFNHVFPGSHMYVLYYILDLIYGEKHVYVLYIHFLYWYLVLYLKCMSKHGNILWSLVAD